MPDSPLPPLFSFEAEQAKTAAMKKIHARQQEALVDNWYSIFPDDKDPLTPEKVQRKYNELTHPAANSTGTKQKYSHIGGKLLATADTIEEYGNNFAASVDEGTSVGVGMLGGDSWLGKLLNQIWTAVRAFFDWMGGNSKSFTEAYAKITTQDIHQSFDEKMQALGKNPEHAAFMQQTGLVDQGKKAIAQKVQAEAGSPGSADMEPDFNLDDYISTKAPKPPVKKEYKAPAKDASLEDSVIGAIANAIENTKNAIPGGTASLTPEQVKEIKNLEDKLIANSKAIAISPDAPQDSAEFSERVIRKTADEVKISLGENAGKLPFDQVISALKESKNEQQAQYGFLLGILYQELQEAHTVIKNPTGTKPEPVPEVGKTETPGVPAPDEKKIEESIAGTNKGTAEKEPKPVVDEQAEQKAVEAKRAAEAKRIAAEQAKELKKLQSRAKDMETLITTTATAAVKNGIRDEVANGVINSYDAAWISTGYGDVKNEIIAIKEFRRTHLKGTNEEILGVQKDKLYTFAYTNEYALAPNQVNTIAGIVENTVKAIVRNPENKNISQNQMAQKIQQAVLQNLSTQKDNIDKLGSYKIDSYKKDGKESDIFAEIAGQIYAAINGDKGGIYKKLKGAQEVILKADAALAAEKSPKVKNPGIKRDPNSPDPEIADNRARPTIPQPPPTNTPNRSAPTPR